MDDHFTICLARNHLADALKALLKAEIMTDEDFLVSRKATMDRPQAIGLTPSNL